MVNPKISALADAFTGSVINTALWSANSGTLTLDTVNDQVAIAVPTTAGTAMLGEGALYDATGSSVYAQVTIAANGNGATRSVMRIRLDAANSVRMTVESGVFRLILVTANVTSSLPLPAYDAQAHRWWRLREAGSVFFADASADGLNWTTLGSTAYTWDATAVTVRFEATSTATEVAGNATVVSRINTRAAGPYNPNWPLVEHGAGLAWGANGAASPLDLYVDVSARTQGGTDIGRGRNYETDQVRAGDDSVTLSNSDGALDPTSATTPLAGRMQPFQPYRIRSMWPAAVNLLSPGIAAGGSFGTAPLGTISPTAVLDLASDTDASGGAVVASASAWIGTAVTSLGVTVSTAAGQRIVHSGQTAVIPGAPYAVTIHVRDVTASTSLQVKAALGWVTAGSMTPSSYTYGTTTTLTGASTAGWSALTVSGTAPAGALGMDVGVAVAATATATCTVQTDGWQLEHGLTPSAWVMPGAWQQLSGMFTEDWPSQWTMSGTYGTVSPSASDAFGLLSQLTLDDPLTAEINSHSPRFLYRLNDPSGSTSATDATGSYPAIQVANGKYGASSIAFGTDITATDPIGGIYAGSTDTVAHFNNPSPGQNVNGPCTYLSLSSAGINGPANPTSAWTRIIAFRYTGPTPPYSADLWTAADKQRVGNTLSGSNIALFINSAGRLALNMGGPTGAGVGFDPTSTSVVDGNWHLFIFVVNPNTSTMTFRLDGNAYSAGLTTSLLPVGITMDSVGAFVDNQVKFTSANFAGDLSFVAEFPVALTTTDCDNLYSAWRAACSGESTDARYRRILRYAGFQGPTAIQAGLTTSMGPAALGGQDVVSALEDVVTTEGGSHFIARDGTPTFRSRGSRYNATIPSVIFGERADLGEWPYEDVQVVWDSTHLANKVTVTQASTGQTFYAQDPASIAAYFPRVLTRTVNATSALEVQDAANYLKGRYRNPLSRVTSLVLHPSAYPALWPVCLGLELGTRARVMRRPPGVAPTQLEVFVENLAWSMDDQANATLTLQCSPADTTLYGTFSAWRSTLAASISSGVSTVTIAASADITQPLALQMPRGQQLILGEGTANQETVTVLTVGATSPGWTAATITLAAATTRSHSTGDITCEPLPAGVTDPSTWDAASRFDSVAFAY